LFLWTAEAPPSTYSWDGCAMFPPGGWIVETWPVPPATRTLVVLYLATYGMLNLTLFIFLFIAGSVLLPTGSTFWSTLSWFGAFTLPLFLVVAAEPPVKLRTCYYYCCCWGAGKLLNCSQFIWRRWLIFEFMFFCGFELSFWEVLIWDYEFPMLFDDDCVVSCICLSFYFWADYKAFCCETLKFVPVAVKFPFDGSWEVNLAFLWPRMLLASALAIFWI